jgi:hypothetical protein
MKLTCLISLSRSGDKQRTRLSIQAPLTWKYPGQIWTIQTPQHIKWQKYLIGKRLKRSRQSLQLTCKVSFRYAKETSNSACNSSLKILKKLSWPLNLWSLFNKKTKKIENHFISNWWKDLVNTIIVTKQCLSRRPNLSSSCLTNRAAIQSSQLWRVWITPAS